jgi:hypothetical protein
MLVALTSLTGGLVIVTFSVGSEQPVWTDSLLASPE